MKSVIWLILMIIFGILLFNVTTVYAMAGCTSGLLCSLMCLLISIGKDEFKDL